MRRAGLRGLAPPWEMVTWEELGKGVRRARRDPEKPLPPWSPALAPCGEKEPR